MTRTWFKPWGWVYRPASWQAVVLIFLAAVFCVQVVIAVDRHSHSVSDTLYGIFPFVVPCLMILNWVVEDKSAGVAGLALTNEMLGTDPVQWLEPTRRRRE
jgi:hypothetical protein